MDHVKFGDRIAASVFEISCGKTDKQKNKQTNTNDAKHPNQALDCRRF